MYFKNVIYPNGEREREKEEWSPIQKSQSHSIEFFWMRNEDDDGNEEETIALYFSFVVFFFVSKAKQISFSVEFAAPLTTQ